MASSRLAHSISSYAHIFSLALENGPFVTITLAPRTRTVVASVGGRSGFPYSRMPRPSIFLIQARISLTSVLLAENESSWLMIKRNFMGIIRDGRTS